MQIQWYPGHMTKAKRAMQDDIKLVDLVIEILDARVPLSSRNPDIDKLAVGKFRMVILNKADLADERTTAAWCRWFADQEIRAVSLDSRNSNAKMKEIKNLIPEVCRAKIERDLKRGIQNRPVRAMVVGIPNVGKSTFINSFAGKSAAKTGNKPGVTKGNQWIRLNKQVELLDTPGILWPKFEDETVGLHLAAVGSINDQVLDIRELAWEFLRDLSDEQLTAVLDRYEVQYDADTNALIDAVAIRRGALKKGGEPDADKAALMIIDDFRTGKLGRLSIERP